MRRAPQQNMNNNEKRRRRRRKKELNNTWFLLHIFCQLTSIINFISQNTHRAKESERARPPPPPPTKSCDATAAPSDHHRASGRKTSYPPTRSTHRNQGAVGSNAVNISALCSPSDSYESRFTCPPACLTTCLLACCRVKFGGCRNVVEEITLPIFISFRLVFPVRHLYYRDAVNAPLLQTRPKKKRA